VQPDLAVDLERLGFGTLWLGGSPDGELLQVDQLLDATTRLSVATGIVNIWKDSARQVAASFRRISRRHPGRFLLGIGAGHRPDQVAARLGEHFAAGADHVAVQLITGPGAEPLDGYRRLAEALAL
jgi:alkanesulfonate monooxygenase SsuD/methylene tetrahydromethanopterin reductase-like flavin-dependent oxidoreductase (luciferase family)